MLASKEIPDVRTRFAEGSVKEDEGKKIPRRKPVFPLSAERELARAFMAVSELIIKKAAPYIQRIMRVYEQGIVRQDARMTPADALSMILDEFGEDVEKSVNVKGLIFGVNRAAKTARNTSVGDWGRLVRDAINEEISEPFYIETMEDMLNKWVGESVSYITSLPKEYLSTVHDIIIWGYNTHQPIVNVYRKLEKLTGATRSQARMIARDQLGTLNSRMTRYEHESVGCTHYKWVTKHDSRVRECHRQLDGRIFSWNNPPAMWYPTISKGIVYTGRYCHPGEDYACRCVASPVFDVEKAERALVRQRVRKR